MGMDSSPAPLYSLVNVIVADLAGQIPSNRLTYGG
jgi:hypothetical protein